jgi:hypothetical protein
LLPRLRAVSLEVIDAPEEMLANTLPRLGRGVVALVEGSVTPTMTSTLPAELLEVVVERNLERLEGHPEVHETRLAFVDLLLASEATRKLVMEGNHAQVRPASHALLSSSLNRAQRLDTFVTQRLAPADTDAAFAFLLRYSSLRGETGVARTTWSALVSQLATSSSPFASARLDTLLVASTADVPSVQPIDPAMGHTLTQWIADALNADETEDEARIDGSELRRVAATLARGGAHA